MATAICRDWWKVNGQHDHFTFDLTKGSHSMKALDAYRETPTSRGEQLAGEDRQHHFAKRAGRFAATDAIKTVQNIDALSSRDLADVAKSLGHGYKGKSRRDQGGDQGQVGGVPDHIRLGAHGVAIQWTQEASNAKAREARRRD